MKQYDPKLERLSTVLMIRGFALLAFAAIAVRWPGQSLSDAVSYAGGIAVFLGIAELGIALAGHSLLSVRAFRVGHAILSIAFGIVAGLVMTLPLMRAMGIAMIWLAAYTAFLLLLAARLWYFTRMRDALLLWAAVNATAIVVCAQLTTASRTSVLLAGALYTATLGVVTITAARWMRRGWMGVERIAFQR
jgi:hypothetical protein